MLEVSAFCKHICKYISRYRNIPLFTCASSLQAPRSRSPWSVSISTRQPHLKNPSANFFSEISNPLMENPESTEIIKKPTTLLNLCIKSASKNKHSIEKWRRQRRTLEKLPPHLANQLLHRLLHRRLLFPSLLEVFQYCVEEINLSGESMVDSEWMAYLGAFRFLKCLNVADCRGVNNSSIWPITGMDCLKELDLSRCQKLTDASVLHLISIQNLEKLSVAETSLTIDGVKQLSALTKLSVLDLGGLPVTDMALSSLQCLTKLEYLDIWGSKISNNGTALLKAFGKLRFLNTAWTKVTTLPYLPSLTCLNMSNCSVLSIFEEVHYKAKPSLLEKLHITGITSTNANDIFTNINPSQLSFLDLSSSPLQKFEFLVTMTSLQHLDISSCGLKDESIELIAQIGTTLKFLNLSNTRLRSSAIASLAGCVPNIETLILSETEVDDDVLLYISMMPSLKVLDLSCNTNITGKGKGEILSLSALQTLKHLEKLILDGTQVRDAALQPLASVEKLKFLSLQSDFISDESLHILSSFRKLEILGIRGAVLSNEGLLSFNPPPKLKILDVRDSWLLSKDAVLSFQDYHPMIEVKHKHAELLSTAQISSSHRSPGHPGHRNVRVVPSKSKWTNFSSVPPQIRKEFFVDERLKYNREELLELQQSPLSQISYLDGNTVLPDTV